jgi:type IV secretion system protein VirD4
MPDRRLSLYKKWLRLTLTAAIQQLMSETKPGKVPVAIVCDDAATLGHLSIIEDTVAQMRGYGLKLITIWQGIDQLKAMYHERWESFIGNAGVLLSFAPQDVVTSEYLSQRCGMTTKQTESRNINLNLHDKQASSYNMSASQNPYQIPLMLPQDIRGMPAAHSLVFSHKIPKTGVVRGYCPFPTQLHGLQDICALDPSLR